MKVICIDASPNKHGVKPPFKEGETLTASQCPQFINNYLIAEYPLSPLTNQECSFSKNRFIPLSNIDEMELVKEKLQTILN